MASRSCSPRQAAPLRGPRPIPVLGLLAAVLLGVGVGVGRGRASEAANELAQLQERCKELIAIQFKLAEAQPLVERLLALTLEQRGEWHQDTVQALHWVGFLAQQDGRYAEAEQTWQRTLAIQEKLPTPNPEWVSRTLHMLAGLARLQFDFPRAEHFLKRALEIREKALGPDHPQTVGVVRTMGRLAEQAGNFAQAESLHRRALAAQERAGRYYELEVAETLSALANIYLSLGDPDQAEPLVTRALVLTEQVRGSEHTITVNRLCDLGAVRHYRGDLAGAEEAYRRSLQLGEKLGGPQDLTLRGPLHQLGLLCFQMDRLDEAEAVIERLLDITRSKLGPANPDLSSGLGILGQICERRADYARAREYFDEALRLSEQSVGPVHFDNAGFGRRLARMQYLLGQRPAAVAGAARIQDSEESRLADTLSFTSERQRLIYQNYISTDAYDLWATIDAPAPLARAVLRTKGVVLDSLLEDRLLAEVSGNPEIRRHADELARLKLRLAQLRPWDQSPGTPGTHPPETVLPNADYESVARQFESAEAVLARQITGLGRGRRALSVKTEAVTDALPEHAALIEFLRYQHYLGRGKSTGSYGALILVRGQEPKWVPLAEAKPVDKNLRLYQHLVRRGTDEGSLAGLLAELHDQLWAPVAKALPAQTRQLILCPDGQLNFLSFATLLTSSNRFLAEDYEISYVSSGRDLLAERVPPTGDRDLVIWANPDFGLTNSSPISDPPLAIASAQAEALRGLDFRPLPGAEKEGRWLVERAGDFGFQRPSLFLGRHATELQLSAVRSPQVLHFATHGFVFPRRDPPRPPASPNIKPALSRPSLVNPMLYSGLALAGAKRTLEAWAQGQDVAPDNDGIVSAAEIGCLNLKGTQLVVLSACDTGLGEARSGEGVLGLRRGFIQAGAQRLLLTLWPITDQSTSGFMPEVYTATHATGSPARALALVQRSWLKRIRENKGVAEACIVAGPFILSFQGRSEAAR